MRIGVDLGGTNIRAGLVKDGTIIRKAKVACPAKGTAEEVLETVAGLIGEVLREGVESIGIGVGSGIIIDGKLYEGRNAGAGEVGCLYYLLYFVVYNMIARLTYQRNNRNEQIIKV